MAEVTTAEGWQLSDGEIHYLWWFIQGSIMEPHVRSRLRRAWGMCERHAWGALAVEAAFRSDFLHGPALLYEDLMRRALVALELKGQWRAARLARRLRPAGPCHMCEMGLGSASRGMARPELIERGRDTGSLRVFAGRTRAYWWKTVCGQCLGDGSSPRCRPHLLEVVSGGGTVALTSHRALVERILKHLTVYARSFRWECRNTEGDEDRAALLSAVGWCSGWPAWFVGILTDGRA